MDIIPTYQLYMNIINQQQLLLAYQDGLTENEDFQTNYINISQSAEDITTKIELVKKCLENKYIGELDEENMKEMAIKGYVAGLRR